MSKIKELLESPGHVQEIEYSFKIKICGKEDCGIYTCFGRTVCTPWVVKNKTRKELLGFHDSHIPNHVDKCHFLLVSKSRYYIGKTK